VEGDCGGRGGATVGGGSTSTALLETPPEGMKDGLKGIGQLN
jgi:hypothetical protein